MVPPTSREVPRVSRYSGYCRPGSDFAYGTFTSYGLPSQCSSAILADTLSQSITPECSHSGLGSPAFARRYLRDRCFFLFLRLLRCFSSPGSPPWLMYWAMDDGGPLRRVSPFGHLRIDGYLRLPAAFRSLLRPSSALSAKASTLRSCSLTDHRCYLLIFGATENCPFSAAACGD